MVSIGLRPATMDDWRFLLDLKNDPVMRKFAVVTHKRILKKDHIKWLEKHVHEMDIILYKKKMAGMIRLDRDREISINILPEFRGKGIGTYVLSGWKDVWAKIVNGNVASMRLFLGSGFKVVGYEKNYYVLTK